MATQEVPNIEQLLTAILAVLVADREEIGSNEKDRRKTEVLLEGAGLSVNAIAALMGKKPDAVRKTLQRAR